MKFALRLLAALFALVGVIWILQGTNVLPGSFMTGQIKWAVFGTIALAVGSALWWWAGRRDTPSP